MDLMDEPDRIGEDGSAIYVDNDGRVQIGSVESIDARIEYLYEVIEVSERQKTGALLEIAELQAKLRERR